MSIRTRRHIPSRRTWSRAAAAVAAIALAGGLASAPVAAGAAEQADSSLTVRWTGDTSRAAALQPDRAHTSLSQKMGRTGEITNPHYDDFKNLAVTVDHTQGLTEQVVHLKVSGMPGGTIGGDRTLAGLRQEDPPALEQNFLQIMQCWGDPAAQDFAQTCQFGGFAVGTGTASGLMADAGIRDSTDGDVEVPFRSVQGKDYYEQEYRHRGKDPLLAEILQSKTTNELVGVPVRQDGTATIAFQVFRASAPWLGCGAGEDGAAPRSCSLVIVPRGTVYGGVKTLPAGASGAGVAYAGTGVQAGSPINPDFDYWDNRIVIPLDFAPRVASCAAGSSGTGVIGGSPLPEAAFLSWQKRACTERGVSFNWSPSSSEAVGRDQLMQGSARIAFTQRPVQTTEGTDILYAPVTVSGFTIAFNFQGMRGVRTDLKLTPRLIAKLLTQSYLAGVPVWNNDFHAEHLPVNATQGLPTSSVYYDPEFTTLNPTLDQYSDFQGAGIGDLILMGPSASDSIQLLWGYLQADDKARAFLSGEPDNVLPGDEKNSGMRINPYYLPKGDPRAVVPATEETDASVDGAPARELRYVEGAKRAVGLTDADGAPLDLSRNAIATFPQADETVSPWRTLVSRSTSQTIAPVSRISTGDYNPYGETLKRVAERLFAGDSQRADWDTGKFVPGQSGVGDWTAGPRSLLPKLSLVGTSDTASAAEYGLSTAELQLPNREGVFAAPTTASMTAALAAQRPVNGGATGWTDFGALAADAYPMTIVTYAGLNATVLADKPDERAVYADFIDDAVTAGQRPGTAAGQLPDGFAPLTEALRAQALAVTACLRTDDAAGCRSQRSTQTQGSSTSPGSGSPGTGAASAAAATAAAGAPQTAYAQSGNPANTPQTPASSSTAAGVLGGTLAAGVIGAAVAPFLLRRRPMS